MNYEERYNELIDAIKEMMEANPHDEGLQNWVQDNVPELAESDDERIRKALIRFHKGTIDIDGIKGDEIVSWLEKQVEPVDKGEISDGFHTFNELYYYRMLYNAAFFNILPKEWVHKSKKHNDGEECFGGGWFIVMANLPTGQISNHYELKDWDLFQIPEKERADKWDGHTPQEAAERLHKYLLETQGEHETDFKFELNFDFNVGQWIVACGKQVFLITKIDGFNITLVDTNGDKYVFDVDSLKDARLWTIEDAKPGDVLYYKSDNNIEYIVMNKGINMHDNIDSYFRYNSFDGFAVDVPAVLSKNDNITLATKEQCDTLERAITNAGYRWDKEKLKLEKI